MVSEEGDQHAHLAVTGSDGQRLFDFMIELFDEVQKPCELMAGYA